ncbi:MAG TPA: methyltransferase domain-containing protein [Bryobacteraceae bacterium]|nr:methyltransferase domain-containing protein [Bryobacteraceae bacterium]
MSLEKWNQRYRSGEQLFETPAPLLEQVAASLPPGDALDLACGPGRNALYLAGRGWRVTAVDGSEPAIHLLRGRARQRKLQVKTRVADLERGEFAIPSESFDLICDCYYLHRSLIPDMQRGTRAGGMVIAIVHLAGPGQPEGTATRATPGELRKFFEGWIIRHYYEGESRESCHRRAVAEIVARKPPPV